ncbi:MAG: hypothetical protein ACKVUT_06970 [Gaiella sp.]
MLRLFAVSWLFHLKNLTASLFLGRYADRRDDLFYVVGNAVQVSAMSWVSG